MSTACSRASLLSLPDEHLKSVLQHIESDGELEDELFPLLTVCRRLSPLVRDQLYHDITIRSVNRASMLRDALIADPARRHLVETVHLHPLLAIDPDEDDDEAWQALKRNDYIAADEGVPEILGLLNQVLTPREIQLTKFSLSALVRIIGHMGATGSKVRVVWMSGIRHVDLVEDLGAARTTLWARLAELPRLAAIFLGATGDVALMPSVYAPLQSVKSVFKAVIPRKISPPEGSHPLAAILPSLQKLLIHGDGDGPAMARHWLTTAPISLTRLKLAGAFTFDTQESLARFPHLTHLTITEGSFDPERFLHYLTRSKMRILEFFTRAPVSDAFLYKIVAGPRRVKSLLRLVLDHHAPPLTDTALRAGLDKVVEKHSLTKLAAFRDRARPVWPEGCTEIGLEAILAAASSNGVDVRGRALRCLNWERRFDEELERCLVEHAHPEEPHMVLEQVLGRERAVRALRTRRPELFVLVNGGCEPRVTSIAATDE